MKTLAAPRMPPITKALRQPRSIPTRPNRNDSEAPTVNELNVPRRNAGSDRPFGCVGERPQAGHIHAGHGDAGQSAEPKCREQTVRQRDAEAGQGAERARGEINLTRGPAIGEADERDNDEHIASRDDPGEPSGLRVGQRPDFDELRQQRRNDREAGQAQDFGDAYGGNDCR